MKPWMDWPEETLKRLENIDDTEWKGFKVNLYRRICLNSLREIAVGVVLRLFQMHP